MTDLARLQQLNDQRWHSAKLSGRLNFKPLATKAYKNRDRYLDIVRRCRERGSNMPDEAWTFVAAIHMRESTLNFSTHLGQGDPLSRKTVHVPAGRGPFTGPDAFERGAVDALVDCAPYAALRNKDWSISGMLTYFERYNGLAYANADRPSPYLWSGTTIYDPPTGPGGKVTVDYGPIVNSVVDKQLGVAGFMLALDELDDTVSFSEVPSASAVTGETTLAPRPNTYDMVWVQWALNQLGSYPSLLIDGISGTNTKRAIRAFQKAHKLRVDGIAGTRETIPAMRIELENRDIPLFPV